GGAAGRTETPPSTNPGRKGCPSTNFAESGTFADKLTEPGHQHNLPEGVYNEPAYKRQAGRQANYLREYSFNKANTSPRGTQAGYANALLGNYRQYAEGGKNIGDWWFWQVEFYLQDSWRVRRRLTIDAGIRFYGMRPIANVNKGRNASAEFVASAYNRNQE